MRLVATIATVISPQVGRGRASAQAEVRQRPAGTERQAKVAAALLTPRRAVAPRAPRPSSPVCLLGDAVAWAARHLAAVGVVPTAKGDGYPFVPQVRATVTTPANGPLEPLGTRTTPFLAAPTEECGHTRHLCRQTVVRGVGGQTITVAGEVGSRVVELGP